MNKEELISIIIPIYNVEEYLEDCIESVIQQTYKNLEIILVDDGSTDNCLNICNKYKKKDNRIKIIHKENAGLSDARNVGIEFSTGQYIAFVDSDDFIEIDMYEILYQDLKDNRADIIGCDYYIYNTLKFSKSDIITKEKKIMSTEEALIEMSKLRGFGVIACNKLYKRQIFDEIRFPIGKTSEDWFIMYKILDKAKKIVYNPIAKYYYRQRADSITKSNKINWMGLEAATEVLEFSKRKYPNAVVSARFAYINANLEIYNQMLKNKYNRKQRQEFASNIKGEKKGVLRMQGVRLYKKLQIICICYFRVLYDFIIKIKLKTRKVNF